MSQGWTRTSLLSPYQLCMLANRHSSTQRPFSSLLLWFVEANLSSDLVCVHPAFGCLDRLFSQHPLLGHLIKTRCILNEPKKRRGGRETGSKFQCCFGFGQGPKARAIPFLVSTILILAYNTDYISEWEFFVNCQECQGASTTKCHAPYP